MLVQSRMRLLPFQRARPPSLSPRVRYPTISFSARAFKTIPAVILVIIRMHRATTRFNLSLMKLSCRTAGAVAKLKDISCYFDTPGFNASQGGCSDGPHTVKLVRCLPSDTRTHAVLLLFIYRSSPIPPPCSLSIITSSQTLQAQVSAPSLLHPGTVVRHSSSLRRWLRSTLPILPISTGCSWPVNRVRLACLL